MLLTTLLVWLTSLTSLISAHTIPTYKFDSLTAYTSNGPIRGHTSSNTSQVIEYLGIPYAEPPIGDLRFASPKKYATHGLQNASTWGLDCPAPRSPPSQYPGLTAQAQRILYDFIQPINTPQGEDCLTLNIWQSRRHHQRAVIVFFHGGRFTEGSTNTPFYNGQRLAQSQDVIVVTVNFRSNIFGYPGRNLGLQDQRIAVEWIRDNIHAFGGDASKIILMGQSAGAVAVDYWSYAYADDPIASGFISHSGNALSFGLSPAGVVEKNFLNVSAQLGCDTGDILSCMRKQDWRDIQAAAAKIRNTPSSSPFRSTPGFYPVVDNKTVFADYETLSNNGQFAKMPYFLGNTNNEQGLYKLIAYANGVDTTSAQGDAFLLSSFTCPNFFEALNRKKAGVPVWLWRYFGNWTNLELYAGSGAYHGSDLEMIFGNDEQVSGIAPSIKEEQTTMAMQAAWSAFANDPVNGLTKLGYPRFDLETDSLLRLAYDQDPQASFVSLADYARQCANITLAGANN